MNNLKIGDIIEFTGDELVPVLHKAEVRGICGSIVFTREILEVGVTATSFSELEDLITFGWKLPDSIGNLAKQL